MYHTWGFFSSHIYTVSCQCFSLQRISLQVHRFEWLHCWPVTFSCFRNLAPWSLRGWFSEFHHDAREPIVLIVCPERGEKCKLLNVRFHVGLDILEELWELPLCCFSGFKAGALLSKLCLVPTFDESKRCLGEVNRALHIIQRLFLMVLETNRN